MFLQPLYMCAQDTHMCEHTHTHHHHHTYYTLTCKIKDHNTFEALGVSKAHIPPHTQAAQAWKVSQGEKCSNECKVACKVAM